MRTPRSALLAAALALVSLAPAAAGAAPTAKDRAEARSLAAEARSALKQQRFDEAVEALRRADELAPSLQIKLDLGRALVGAGNLIEASTLLHQVEGARAKTFYEKKAKAAAKKLVGEVERRIPWVQVAIVGPKVDEATTTIDDTEVDPSIEGPVDPGEHVIVVEADGWERAEKSFTIEEGSHDTVRVKMQRVEVAVAAAPPPESGGSKIPAAIAFGVGAVGTGVGAVFGVLAFTRTSAAKERCDGNVCPGDTKTVAARDEAVRNGNISTVGFVVGGVGVATGIILLLVSSGSSEPSDAAKDEGAWVRPWVGPSQAGLLGAF